MHLVMQAKIEKEFLGQLTLQAVSSQMSNASQAVGDGRFLPEPSISPKIFFLFSDNELGFLFFSAQYHWI